MTSSTQVLRCACVLAVMAVTSAVAGVVADPVADPVAGPLTGVAARVSGLQCGKQGLIATALIAGGEDVEPGEFPWHAVVYRPQETGNGTLQQLCGGTLIAPRVVISAALCFWDPQRAKMKNITTYRVALGKLLRGWDDDEVDAQRMEIEQVVLHDTYSGSDNNYLHDIAVVILKTPAVLSDHVNLACVDWDNSLEQQQLALGRSGIVAGMGKLLDGTPSETLQRVRLPWVSRDTCRNATDQWQRKLIAYDKFCAGDKSNKSMCQGDSGSGLVFKDAVTQRFYLQGVVSVALAPFESFNNIECYTQAYSLFTRVSRYLNELINEYRDLQ